VAVTFDDLPVAELRHDRRVHRLSRFTILAGMRRLS